MIKNKIYIVGPKSSGKTTFIHKMMGRDFRMFKDNVVEVTGVPKTIEDAIQVYLIFPEPEELESRGGEWTDDELDEYMTFYHTNMSDVPITMIKDF